MNKMLYNIYRIVATFNDPSINITRRILLFNISVFCYYGLSAQETAPGTINYTLNIDTLKINAVNIKQVHAEAASKVSIINFVLKNEDDSFGYAIFIDGNMTCYQPNIPAVNGNKGFDKFEQAEAAAKLAVQKIKEGEWPPSISVEEIQQIIKD